MWLCLLGATSKFIHPTAWCPSVCICRDVCLEKQELFCRKRNISVDFQDALNGTSTGDQIGKATELWKLLQGGLQRCPFVTQERAEALLLWAYLPALSIAESTIPWFLCTVQHKIFFWDYQIPVMFTLAKLRFLCFIIFQLQFEFSPPFSFSR